MARPPHHHGQLEPKNLPWNRANPKRDCKAALVMTRLPNTPRPGPATRVPARRLAENRAVAMPARGATKERPEELLVPNDPIPRPPMRAPPTGPPANPKPPPRPANPAPPPPTCPPKPPPLPPPPPGRASAASVIGGIVRSKIATVAIP